jgi:DedD protein
MNENNELNDIILNKGGTNTSNKKIILAVATLGIILIIVVMLMNSLSSNSNDNLPQAVLPPEPKTQAIQETDSEPLFEDIEVEEEVDTNANLDQIAKKLKEDSFKEEVVVEEAPVVQKVVKPKPKPKPVVKKTVSKPKTSSRNTTVITGFYYIQVGSFSKYEPNKRFLNSITSLGFNYKYHNVGTLNKVLVGPFKTKKEALNAKRVLRSKVEPGAFLVNLK